MKRLIFFGFFILSGILLERGNRLTISGQKKEKNP